MDLILVGQAHSFFALICRMYNIFPFNLKNYLVILKYIKIVLTYTLHDIRSSSSEIELIIYHTSLFDFIYSFSLFINIKIACSNHGCC